MYKVGVFPGKFLPPHRGHINAIIQAATQVEKLYVVVSCNHDYMKQVCDEDGLRYMPLMMRARWMAKELSGFEHISVYTLDETDIPAYPEGTVPWSEKLKETIPEEFDVIFGGEPEYQHTYMQNFPGVNYVIYDTNRERYPVSATLVRQNPMKYWDYILGSARSHFAKRILITGTESCVDNNTEFFNGVEWKKISEYKKGDKVLQYNYDGSANLVSPDKYIKLKLSNNDKFYKIQNSYNTWSQVYTQDHDLVYITSKGNLAKKKMIDIKNNHFSVKSGFQGKFFGHFLFGNKTLSERYIRLAIAISADGSIARNKWRIRLKKERKILRLRHLIKNAGYEMDERIYSDGYSNFYLPKNAGFKIIPNEWLYLEKKSKDIIVDEIFNWDGYKNTYFTSIKENAEKIQFIFNSAGYKTNWETEDIREGRETGYRIHISSVKYNTISLSKNNFKHKEKMITEYKNHDGYKYCFTVSSGMLVLRRDNHIFITGNCGKTTLTKYLAKIYHTSWSEEYGRYHSTYEFGGNENLFTKEDFKDIAQKQIEYDNHALKTSNRLVFFDTDAVVTHYYRDMYLGEDHTRFEEVDINKYDLIIMLGPEVKWVSDGFRFKSEQEERFRLFRKLYNMYLWYGFDDSKISEIHSDNYHTRLNLVMREIDYLLGK